MTHYRIVSVYIWNDEKFRLLTNDGKLVFLFLLTHPSMTALGAMRHSLAGMAAELQWDTEAFVKAFEEASVKGMVKADLKASFIWLPNFLKYNPPQSPNVVKSWVRWAELLPECDMKVQLAQAVMVFLEGMGKAFQEALPEALRKGFQKALPNQYQYQEQKRNGKHRRPYIGRDPSQRSADGGSSRGEEVEEWEVRK